MLGHLMEWLFSGLGGIRQAADSFGFRHIVIRPEPVGDVRSAQTTYESPYGQIVADWQDNDDAFILRVEVPANISASVYLPTTDTALISESGTPLHSLTEAKISTEKENTIVTVGSGRYYFKVKKEK